MDQKNQQKTIKYSLIFLFIGLTLFSRESYSIPSFSGSDRKKEDTILQADQVQSDRNKNIIKAIGNVEIENGSAVATSDEASFDKNTNIIKAAGNFVIKDPSLGNIYAPKGEITRDFSKGKLPNSTIVFDDGSYMKSQEIDKRSEDLVILRSPVFSICPNDKIVKNNEKAGELFDMISIKSKSTTINKEKSEIISKHAIVKIYNLPVLYTPYLSIPSRENKRKSGFLTPSYVNNSIFGIGFNAPYFIDVAPNIDYTITPRIYPNSSQLIVKNEVEQLVKYGKHKTSLELANNKIDDQTDRNVQVRTSKNLRYDFRSAGDYIFDHNNRLTHNINTVGDRNYLRDYNFDFSAFTESQINYDYTKDRDYFGVNSVRFQELEPNQSPKSAQFVLPSVTYIKQSKKPIFFKERYKLESNLTSITRESGLQYRRLTSTPEVNIPFNISGNLIDLNSKLQLDYYSLEENNRLNEEKQNLDNSIFNYKPEISLTWRLPLIQKLSSNTLMVEPIASLVSSSFEKKSSKLPNEDSNSSELTVNNIFNSDRISGYDRNEAGERISYGAKTAMFNDLGQFEMTLAQSYRINETSQDVDIRGFNDNNKSNIVGLFSYTLPSIFSVKYLFQLDESSYSNNVNSLQISLNINNKLRIQNDYILLRKDILSSSKREQNTFQVQYDFTKKFRTTASITRDLERGKDLLRKLSFEYGGCCTLLNITTTENNSSNLTETQRSHSINITIKDL